jgi:hypothetical protein
MQTMCPQVVRTTSRELVTLPTSKQEGAPPTSRVFGRLRDLAQISKAAKALPVQVTLFTGPPNSGKSVLFKEFSEARQHEGVCYIDCQDVNTETPAGRSGVLPRILTKPGYWCRHECCAVVLHRKTAADSWYLPMASAWSLTQRLLQVG